MNFDTLNQNPCVIPASLIAGQTSGSGPGQTDPRCSDAAFAAANPDVCSGEYLVIKPAMSVIEVLASIQFTVFLYKAGVESQVIDFLNFTSENPSAFVVGATSGNGTGLAVGTAVVTVTRMGLTASADVTVIAIGSGCSGVEADTLMLVDASLSSSQKFGANYATKLDFAKAVATTWADKIIQINGSAKDAISVWSFGDAAQDLSNGYLTDTTQLATVINGVQQLSGKTDIQDPFTAAVADLGSQSSTEQIILIISDGAQNDYADPSALLAAAAAFKAAGGIIVCIGLRATGAGFDLLDRLATGGFFLNATAANAANVLLGLSYIKSALCIGFCANAEQDSYAYLGEDDYSSYLNWSVIAGQTNLIGNGYFDLLPGNGLYVELASNNNPALIQSIDTFNLVAGQEYTISFDLAGNNVAANPAAAQSVLFYIQAVGAAPTTPPIYQHVVSPAWDSPFTTYSFTFLCQANATVQLYFQQQAASGFLGAFEGNLLDNVSFTNATTLVNLLTDTFDTENYSYVPPNCGEGNVGIPYLVPYVTHGLGKIALIPPMTSDTTPSGVASASAEPSPTGSAWKAFSGVQNDAWLSPSTVSNPSWIQYQSVSQSVAASYQFNVRNPLFNNTVSWIFQGSNDGSTWTNLDSQSGYTLPANTVVMSFNISNTQAFSYYRLYLLPIFYSFLNAPTIAYFQVFSNSGYGISYLTESLHQFGYNCYDSCSASVVFGGQYQDPNPLPDIESGAVSQQLYTSTKSYCGSCPSGTVGQASTNLIPAMTGNTLPSGVASASSDYGSGISAPFWAFDLNPATQWIVSGSSGGWIQYQFPSAQTVAIYTIQAPAKAAISPLNVAAPANWSFQGSNDGSTWRTLDTQAAIVFMPGQTLSFAVETPAAYSYYQLNITAGYTVGTAQANTQVSVAGLAMYSQASSQICKSATATSYISQADADAKALAAATQVAAASLNCIAVYESTQTYTASCPVGSLSTQTATATETASSLISQADADASALASAKAAAIAMLNCTNSNNGQQITINDVAPATPYPSVSYQNVTGTISSVLVFVNGFAHTYPKDVKMVLMGPDGTTCALMMHCGGGAGVTGINLEFIDSASSHLPTADGAGSPITAGSFKPTQNGSYPSMESPGPQQPYGTTLSVFSGKSPTGAWSLWVDDDNPINVGSIASWQVEFVLA